MILTRLRQCHLEALELQEAQAYLGADIISPGYLDILLQGQAFTGLVGDRVIGCAGCIEQWEGRAIAWALVSKDAGRHMVSVHRAVAGFIAQAPWRRIETTVDSSFDAGHRWMELLGFTHEGRMRAYGPQGQDFDIYARVKS